MKKETKESFPTMLNYINKHFKVDLTDAIGIIADKPTALDSAKLAIIDIWQNSTNTVDNYLDSEKVAKCAIRAFLEGQDMERLSNIVSEKVWLPMPDENYAVVTFIINALLEELE